MEKPASFRAEFKDAIAPRTALLVVGALLIQLLFIWSYVMAFHEPTPHGVQVAVVTSPTDEVHVIDGLNMLTGHPLEASSASSLSTARSQLQDRKVAGIFLPSTVSTTDQLVVLSAASPSAALAVTAVFEKIDRSLHRTVEVDDLLAPLPSDRQSLTSFYLVVGWIVGGYVVASLLGISFGSRPANSRRAVIRVGALILYALASGLLGALLVGPVLHALPSHVGSLWWLGALLVFSVSVFTLALQVAFGTLGIGVTILLFVVLGNPSAGGPYAWSLLPGFWRRIGPWIPNGAGTDAARSLSYLGGAAITRDVLVLVVYALLGLLVTFLIVGITRRSLVRLPGDSRDLVEPLHPVADEVAS